MKPPQAGLIVDPKPLVIQITIDNDTGAIQFAASRDIPGLYAIWVLAKLQEVFSEQGLAAAVQHPGKNVGGSVGNSGATGGN